MIPIFKLLGIIVKTFSKPISAVLKTATRNPTGKVRYFFIAGGKKVFYFEGAVSRVFANKSLKDFTPKYPKDEKCIDIFNDFLVEIVIIYGFIGGYAISEAMDKAQKSEKEKEERKMVFELVDENKEKCEEIYSQIAILQDNIIQNAMLIKQLQETQSVNQQLEQKIEKLLTIQQQQYVNQSQQQEQQQDQNNSEQI